MALFGLSDITFSNGVSERKGPLAVLSTNQFQTTTLRYPLDVGSPDKAHYVIFYIRKQKKSTSGGAPFDGGNLGFEKANAALQAGVEQQIKGALNTATSSVQNMSKNFGTEILGKINSGLNQINTSTNGALSGITSAISNAAGGAVSGINNLFAKASVSITGAQAETTATIDSSIKKITNKSILRSTILTTDAIALYMPDTLNYEYTQSYDDSINLGNSVLGTLGAAGKASLEKFKAEGSLGDGAISTLKSVVPELGEKAVRSGATRVADKILGEGSGAAGSAFIGAVTGKVSNPMLDMIYKGPNFRGFQFDFTFYPRDEREALETQRIIERFRFHQSPELSSDAGMFLIPPSEFDIKFYYAGAENPNIPPIADGCVLDGIIVNYAPNGFTAYEVPGENKPALGRTGMPVSIQVTLNFKETTYLTKADFKDDSGKQTLTRGI